MLVLSVTPEKAPDKETEITMTFEAGVPKTLNGKAMKVSEIITELNKLGGENGIGIIDIVENRVVGMKSVVFMRLLVEQSLWKHMNSLRS